VTTINQGWRWTAAAIALLLLSGCVSHTVKRVDTTPPRQSSELLPEEQLLNVGVLHFDENVPDDWEQRERDGIMPEVRRAEARFMPYLLKNTLETTASWGAVRVLPRYSNAVDVVVTGTLVESHGETLKLDVAVRDSTGRQWYQRRYAHQASRYSYDEDAPENLDPFQTLYNEIANDMLTFRETLTPQQVGQIRATSEMRFAREFAPDMFENYVVEKNGRYEIARLPAEDEPMMARVGRIRDREYLFIDTLDEHYANFVRDMRPAYTSYREHSYEEAVALREMRESARNRTLVGAAAIVSGVVGAYRSETQLGRGLSHLGIFGGAYLLKSGLDRREEARLHAFTLQELGASLERGLTSSIIELDDRTYTLTGTVDEQYEQWRGILRDMYHAEFGHPSTNASANGSD
jgi:hypothetical protein